MKPSVRNLVGLLTIAFIPSASGGDNAPDAPPIAAAMDKQAFIAPASEALGFSTQFGIGAKVGGTALELQNTCTIGESRRSSRTIISCPNDDGNTQHYSCTGNNAPCKKM